MAQPRRVLIIVNPATGAVPTWRLRRLIERVAEHSNIVVEHVETEYADHATEIVTARGAEFDSVVAVGGDGTLSEVVAGAVGHGLQVGIVPTGSTNMVAKDLGIPRLLSQAVRVALTSSTYVAIDVARADSHVFMHMGGAGYDAAIMRETSGRWKRIFRWLAYVGPALRQLRSPPFDVRLVLGERGERIVEHRSRMVLLALAGSIIHPRFVVGEGIDRTDGALDIVVFDPSNIFYVLETFGWFILGRPARSRWQHQYRCRRARIESDARVPFELDGSYRGELPIDVEMLDSQVEILVPSIPTPGEIQAHLHAKPDLGKAEYEITGRSALV